MGLVNEIRETRKRRNQADERVEAKRDHLTELKREAEESERDIARWKERRREALDELQAEVDADSRTAGEHTDAWEARKRAKRDELADLIEAEEARLDRLLGRLDELHSDRDEWAELRHRQNERLKRLRKKRERIREEREGRLTEHFHVAEFDCRDGTPVPEAALPALKALCEEVLEPQRARFGPITINSGFRTASYNASVGGASNSIHIYTEHPNAAAADHAASSGSAREWFDNTAGRAAGRGLYATFHHADNRGRIGWADSVWSG